MDVRGKGRTGRREDLVAGEVPHATVGVSRTRPVLLWFRRDLRLADNLALDGASRTGRPGIPL
ncbi:MAG: deoxyribodipyrimidine photo-lyase, partial [Acidobacteria bacterium]|nr:deoxyribodipyrimidine photo-lyase [Acidobacteriota bacterium]